ncbi:DUF899 family protein [Parasphingopyxis algicola]|uniref:DUF899 family protein n=1 Tax=Parasphingopyxis algicola TaxID=2026624 RepID=UPI00159FFAE5|nr:DUF899 family protein [Parasphingopyxis algicola]QLC23688.1 DUF899 family protein [Parasphingopyxis algicola]
MTNGTPLVPAAELAARNPTRFPNESDAYREARNALLAEEIELRRHIERVSEQRRGLPPGGEVTGDFRFESAEGSITFAELFGDRATLIAYSFMYGPERERPCPMCTSLLDSWDGNAQHVGRRAALAIIARSPIERLQAFKAERGWTHLDFYADISGDYTRAYVSADDADIPAYNVFTRKDSVIRHFWSAEMFAGTADPGQDPRGAPDMVPLWTILDTTPEGRGTDWYPQLDYRA